MTRVTLSDEALAALAFAAANQELNEQAQILTGQQYLHLAAIRNLSYQHEQLLAKRAALEEAAARI